MDRRNRPAGARDNTRSSSARSVSEHPASHTDAGARCNSACNARTLANPSATGNHAGSSSALTAKKSHSGRAPQRSAARWSLQPRLA